MTEPAKAAPAGNVKPSWAFALRGEGTDTLELDIFDNVGAGGFFFEGITAKSVRQRLAENADAKTIKVRINSKGGDVTDGLAIYQQLLDHKATIDVQIVSLAASIASVIAMAGDTITISAAGFVMIHEPFAMFMIGAGAKQLRQRAEVLDQMRDTIADVYIARTGQKKADVLAWMAAETWMRPEQAKERGFVNTIQPMKTKASKEAASAEAFEAFNATGLDVFSNVPEELRELAEQAHASAASTEELPITPTVPAAPAAPYEPTEQKTGAQAQTEKTTMTASLKILASLALAEDADEAAVLGAISKLKASAHAGTEIEKLVGATGQEAVGAVRALKAWQEANAELGNEVAKLKIVNARRDFESARDQGLKDKKLTPATAKLYSERFDAPLKDETLDSDARAEKATAVVSDLKGFLNVAPRLGGGTIISQPGPVSSDAPPQHNGKTFEQMQPREWVTLKRDNPELYATMREDAVERGVI